MTTKTETRFCVIYRTGDRAKFTWNRSPSLDRERTLRQVDAFRARGYKAFMEKYDSSMAIGLPDTYGDD